MGVRQADYRTDRGTELLKLALMEKQANENTPGRVPSGLAENAYFSAMPNTNEQEREAQDYEALDAGANARYQARQNQNTSTDMQTAEAHAHGFPGGIPEQDADTEASALRKILIPEQVKLQAARENATAAQAYQATEHEKDRQARQDMVAAAQAGQTQRSDASLAQNDQHFQQKLPQPSFLARLFGAKAPTAPATPAAAASSVRMMDPDTRETRDVPASQVEQALGLGLIKVQ